MPQAAAAFATGVISHGFAQGSVGALFTSTALTKGLISGGLTFVSQEIQADESFRSGREDPGIRVHGNRMSKEPAPPRVAVYGTVRKSGPIIYFGTSGHDNKFFHTVVYMSEGPVNGINNIWLNDEKVDLSGTAEATDLTANKKYSDLFRARWHSGTDAQTADARLQEEIKPWTSDHRLRGMAYIYVRTKFDRDIFPRGEPNVSFEMEGRSDVNDPRDSTNKFTSNAALCLNHYVQKWQYGLQADSADVDTGTVKSAANVCDETVDSKSRYTTNGVVDSSVKPKSNLEALKRSMAGRFFYSEGKYHMQAGEWTSTTKELDDDDLVDTFSVQTKKSKQGLFNGAKGIYISPEDDWQPTDFEPVTDATAKSNDNGDRLWQDFRLNFTTDHQEARRIVRIELNKNRNQINFTARFRLTALELQVGDTMEFTHPRYGWSKKTFRVTGWRLALETSGDAVRVVVEMNLSEEDSNVYISQTETTNAIKNPVLEFPG